MVNAEGKPEFIFVTVKVFPKTGYYTSWSTDPKTFIDLIASDVIVIVTFCTHGKKV
jgi:hypothetical protein